MSVARLQPSLSAWFESRFQGLTEIQRQALPYTQAGRSTLILAPTGSGKTLSAFLSVLDSLAATATSRQGLPNAVRAIYVSPLKSLDRDIHRNLTPPLDAVNAALRVEMQIRMEVRTGDTEARDRSRQGRRRPHLLLTTPESLAALLSQRAWMDGFDVRTVVVDEIHSFAEGKRGSFLALTLERLEAKCAQPLQRIGLSATAHPVEEITRLLCGCRPCEVVAADATKSHRLSIAVPPPEQWLPPAGHNPYRIAQVAAEMVAQAGCTLLFTTTRSAAERLALALKVLLPEFDEQIGVHHSSIETDERHAIEEGLSAGRYKAVVASSSLEMGVDFQAVDQVLLIGTPRGVSRALQRLGRSGHRVDGVASGALLPTSVPDILQSVALRNAASVGKLDALRVPRAPLDVLAQVLLGMSIERPWGLAEAYERLICAGPYMDLPLQEFEAVLDYLAGGGNVLSAYDAYGKIVIENGRFQVASQRVAREYYLNIGTISDDVQVKIVNRANRRMGEVEEAFLAALQPDEAFIIGGRAVLLDRMHGTTAVVKPATGQRISTPRWMGPKMPLTARLAEEERRLRRELRLAWDSGGADTCRTLLRSEWKAEDEVIERLITFLERQSRAAPIPSDNPIQLEKVPEGRSLLILFHIVAGRAVNRSLAWLLSYRLGVSGSVVANHDDHAFLLSLNPKDAPNAEQLRAAFSPEGFRRDLKAALEKTEMLGRSFRPIAEIGQLIPKRTYRGPIPARASSWNGELLYATLRQHDPGHPLLRETVRTVIDDMMDAERAEAEASRIFATPWEIYDLPRPTPFALPLFAAFSRETLLAQDPDKALDDLVSALYDEWGEDAPPDKPRPRPALKPVKSYQRHRRGRKA